MIRPVKYSGIVTAKEKLINKVTYLVIEHKNPPTMIFSPGQFVSIEVGGHYRAYSIASDADDVRKIELAIETGHDGVGSNYVNNIKVGETIDYVGPSGKFSLGNYQSYDELRFYATGTGVAPFISFLYRLSKEQCDRPIKLYWGLRSELELYFVDKLAYFKSVIKCFDYQIYLSQCSNIPEAEKKGFICNRVEMDDIKPKGVKYYLCGHPSMVSDFIEMLSGSGVPDENIVTEGFTRSQ